MSQRSKTQKRLITIKVRLTVTTERLITSLQILHWLKQFVSWRQEAIMEHGPVVWIPQLDPLNVTVSHQELAMDYGSTPETPILM